MNEHAPAARRWHILDVLTVLVILFAVAWFIGLFWRARIVGARMAATDRQIAAVLRTMTPE